MLDKLITEATDLDFKVALEVKKPKSWLKSVSAFANGIGGVLLFGVDDERRIVGLDHAQEDAEAISRKSRAVRSITSPSAPQPKQWKRSSSFKLG